MEGHRIGKKAFALLKKIAFPIDLIAQLAGVDFDVFEIGMKAIFVLGSLNADLCVYAPRFPKPGETLKGERFHIGNGGKGLNQAIAAAKLGGVVHFLGAVGHVFIKQKKYQLQEKSN